MKDARFGVHEQLPRASLGCFLPGHLRALLARFRKANGNGLLAILHFVLAGPHMMHLRPHFLAGLLAVLAAAGFLL